MISAPVSADIMKHQRWPRMNIGSQTMPVRAQLYSFVRKCSIKINIACLTS